MKRRIMMIALLILIVGKAKSSGFKISGKIIDAESGEGIAGAYISCAVLIETKRNKPLYVEEQEIIKEDARKIKWVKDEIKKKYGEIPEWMEIIFMYKRSKNLNYGYPPGTYRLDVSTWSVAEISEYINPLFNVGYRYSLRNVDIMLSDINEPYKNPLTAKILPMSGRAKSDRDGRFEIKELYAPKKEAVLITKFAKAIGKYHDKSMSGMMKRGEIESIVGVVLEIYKPGYLLTDYGIYPASVSRRHKRFRNINKEEMQSFKSRGGIFEKLIGKIKEKTHKVKYVYLGKGKLGKVVERKGYDRISYEFPGHNEVQGYKIFEGKIPEINTEIAIKRVESEEEKARYRKEIGEICRSGKSWLISERAWSPLWGQAKKEEYKEFKRDLFKECEDKSNENGFGIRTLRGHRKETEESKRTVEQTDPSAEQRWWNKEREKGKEEIPIYEYVPKVIIEGRWGSGPGEFGVVDPMAQDAYGISYKPTSMAVNSKGEIYILDHINNRIQKFDSDGKYLKSIKVFGCADKDGKSVLKVTKLSHGGDRFDFQGGREFKGPYYVGINIVIDSEDNLYYYLKRKNPEYDEEKIKKYEEEVRRAKDREFKAAMSGKKAEKAKELKIIKKFYKLMNEEMRKKWLAEVWLIKNDKVVRKWEVPYSGGGYNETALHKNYYDGKLYIGEWDILENKKRYYSPDNPPKSLSLKRRGFEIHAQGRITKHRGRVLVESFLFEKSSGKKIQVRGGNGVMFLFHSVYMNSKDEIFVAGYESNVLWNYKYDSNGKLAAKIIPVKAYGKGEPDFYDINTFIPMPETRNIIQMSYRYKGIKWNGITITKYELVRVK